MSEQEAAEQTQTPGFWQRNGWVVALTVVLVAAAVGGIWTVMTKQTAIDKQEQRISALERDIAEVESGDQVKIEESAAEILGVDQERVSEDTNTITRLLDRAFTWDSGLGYASARKDIQDTYNLDKNGPFLTDFMPPSRYNEDDEGEKYYYIDSAGLNSKLSKDIDAEVISVRADVYRYAVVATASMSSDDVKQNDSSLAQVQADRKMLLTVSLNGDGEITELSGVPASGTVRSSD